MTSGPPGSCSRRRWLRLGGGLCLAGALPARADGEKLVLVVGAHSPLTALNSHEVHRLFLGLTAIINDRRLRPVRNDSDALMRDVFFQNVVSMSEAVYDRRMLALTLQQAGQPPTVLADTKAVFELLAKDADAVSFAWADAAARDPRIRVLRELWRR